MVSTPSSPDASGKSFDEYCHMLKSSSMKEQQDALDALEFYQKPESVEPLLRYIEKVEDPDLDYRATNLLSAILDTFGATIPKGILEQIETMDDGEHSLVERTVITPTDAGIFRVEENRKTLIGQLKTALQYVSGDTKKDYEERLAAAENYNPDDYAPDQEFTVRPLPPDEEDITRVSHERLRARAREILGE